MTTYLGRLLERFFSRWQQCEMSGGCYSGLHEHDSSCPAWRRSAAADAPCTCGRDELANLEQAIRAEMRKGEK
jgi:hypothetical protein